MDIKGFKIKNQKIQKLWVIILLALIVAILLIIVAFFVVFKRTKMIFSKEDLFNFNSYYTKYSVVTYSNKNQNTYIMEEYCLKNGNDVKFRFNTMNKESNYSYIVTDKEFSIKSDKQINNYINYENIHNSINLLSLSTFINIYNNIYSSIEENSLNKNSGIDVKVEEKDKILCYKIKLKDDIKTSDENINIYIKDITEKMKVSSLELVIDKNTCLPIEYIVYLEDDKAYVDITYSEFEINKKIEEKVFSFLE